MKELLRLSNSSDILIRQFCPLGVSVAAFGSAAFLPHTAKQQNTNLLTANSIE